MDLDKEAKYKMNQIVEFKIPGSGKVYDSPSDRTFAEIRGITHRKVIRRHTMGQYITDYTTYDIGNWQEVPEDLIIRVVEAK